MLSVLTGSKENFVSSGGVIRAIDSGALTAACVTGPVIAVWPTWQTWQCCSSIGLLCQWPADSNANANSARANTVASSRVDFLWGMWNSKPQPKT